MLNTFSEIAKTQKQEKASGEMLCTTLEPVEAEEEGRAWNAKEEMQHWQADQSQVLWSASPWRVVTFLGRVASGYS